MSWKFWEKDGNGKLSGPKQMPGPVGRELVIHSGSDPDWVWNLKCVERPKDGVQNCYEVRIFDENAAAQKGIAVRNYTSMDQAPDLILFEGWYDRKSNRAEVVKRNVRSQG